MSQPVEGLNPKVLTWARETSGQSMEDVAAALKKDIETIESWESGEGAPTYVQLEMLAYKVFRRPLAIFFFPEAPEEPVPEHEFRTLPDFEIEELSPDTRLKIREARALQLSLAELTEGRNPAERQVLRDLSISPSRSPTTAAEAVREYLAVDVRIQREDWKKADDALKAWRAAVEVVGVFVFKDTLEQRDVSGFSLYDAEFPLIYLNNSTAMTRQIFTLFHELAHLLVHTNGVTKRDDSYIAVLSGFAQRVEVFCNEFAAQFLIPDRDFRRDLKGHDRISDDLIREFAKRYKVSREVVLRRLLNMGLISEAAYKKKVAEWRADYEAAKSKQGGGNYYATQASYLSDAYTKVAFTNFYRGNISIEQLADYLNVGVKSVPGLEQFILEKAAT